MKYFTMQTIGFCQLETESTYDWNDPHSLKQFGTSMFGQQRFPDFAPNLFTELQADFTGKFIENDMVHCSYQFVVSHRLQQLLEQHILPSHRVYPNPVFITQRKLLGKKRVETTTKYFYLPIIHDDALEWVDFQNTEVRGHKFTDRTQTTEPVRSAAELRALTTGDSDYAHRAVGRKLYFNDQFPGDIDLFKVPFLSDQTYVSQRLKEAMEAMSITGVSFDEPFVRDRSGSFTPESDEEGDPALFWSEFAR